MPPVLQPIKPFRCTYKDCSASYDSEKMMKSHKKHSDEHDYCPVCDEDFDSYEDLAQHKAYRPDNHGKACRVCGEEFKSESGLKRHIELNHKVDQKLTCVGCNGQFYRASLLIEHLEFGHCRIISTSQFQGHIVHKHLVDQLLHNGPARSRFMEKISKYDATQDTEEEGGISILDQDDSGMFGKEKYEAIRPDTPPEENLVVHPGPYPPLPPSTMMSDITSQFSKTSINGGNSETGTVVGSEDTGRQAKIWGTRAARTLFPNAKPTPPPTPSEYSISQHDQAMETDHGINIMKTRFWDPLSQEWNPDRFYDSVVNMYFCPFICEQTYSIPADLNRHIIQDHRITRVKCPGCCKPFRSVTALMAHCESRGSRCSVNKAYDYGMFVDKLSGGFLGVVEKIRPDHLNNKSVLLTNKETGRPEFYTPPVASYLQYEVTKPADYKEPAQKRVEAAPANKGHTFGVNIRPQW
ncbi:hypothetical protein BDV95DRAFT_631007 [Massariosphaeria phaeospora]|uniref:C2H2-type domain-containing protein n=1 Tax=Massariosphaeria phaeospora TaxID=100035 RepID=A0A7C8I873_9PLEO|nr:hypothetical protein BDV95DRAFT_631007 [Massariosphaeria phaeospora]